MCFKIIYIINVYCLKIQVNLSFKIAVLITGFYVQTSTPAANVVKITTLNLVSLFLNNQKARHASVIYHCAIYTRLSFSI